MSERGAQHGLLKSAEWRRSIVTCQFSVPTKMSKHVHAYVHTHAEQKLQ